MRQTWNPFWELVCVGVCVCVCRGGGLLRGGPRLSSAKFTPAVVMSVGSVSNIPAQKLRPGLCVNLCIQVRYVKSSRAKRPNSGSAGKLVFPDQNLSSSTIPIHPSFLVLSQPLQYSLPLFELLFLPQVKLFHS